MEGFPRTRVNTDMHFMDRGMDMLQHGYKWGLNVSHYSKDFNAVNN